MCVFATKMQQSTMHKDCSNKAKITQHKKQSLRDVNASTTNMQQLNMHEHCDDQTEIKQHRKTTIVARNRRVHDKYASIKHAPKLRRQCGNPTPSQKIGRSTLWGVQVSFLTREWLTMPG